MQEETKEAAKSSIPTTLITTVLTSLLAGNVGGVGDLLHTLLTNAVGENRVATFVVIGLIIIAIRLANALYDTYPDKDTRPRWAQFLISLFPTKLPEKAA